MMAALLDLHVTDRTQIADDVVALTLAAPDGGALPAWTPGAHIDLHLPAGLIRQYSLCSDPADRARYRVAVLRTTDSRGGSAAAHLLREGDTLAVSAPRNTFELDDAERYVLIAGGIGITPILPMARRLTELGRPWRMLYCGRSRTSMAFLDELASLTGPAHEDVLTVVPQDESGLPDLAGFLRGAPEAAVYACGPAGLLEAIGKQCAGPLHIERFAPTPASGPGAGAGSGSGVGTTAAAPPDKPFTLRLARSETDVPVPAGKSALEAIRAAGVEAASSCEMGICGTCETKILAGRPDHRDEILTEAERESGQTLMLCVSRSLDPVLTIDL